MTYDEAIKYAKENILAYTSEMAEFQVIAIEAIQMQIPKKPICREQGTTLILNGVCPKCSNVVHAYDNYCAFCGNKLDWGDIK